MSLPDRFGNMDAAPLVRMGAALSLMLTSTPGFSYNFPLMLFGVVSFELTSTAPHQFFLMMVLFTGVFDLFHVFSSGFGLTTIIALIVMGLKLPIYFSGLTNLRSRGGEIAWGSQGFAPAAWMPASMGGYAGGHPGEHQQQQPHEPHEPTPPGAFQGGGFRLGGDDDAPPPPARTTRDGYTSIA